MTNKKRLLIEDVYCLLKVHKGNGIKVYRFSTEETTYIKTPYCVFIDFGLLKLIDNKTRSITLSDLTEVSLNEIKEHYKI